MYSLYRGINTRQFRRIIGQDRLPGVSYRRTAVARCFRPVGEGGTTSGAKTYEQRRSWPNATSISTSFMQSLFTLNEFSRTFCLIRSSIGHRVSYWRDMISRFVPAAKKRTSSLLERRRCRSRYHNRQSPEVLDHEAGGISGVSSLFTFESKTSMRD